MTSLPELNYFHKKYLSAFLNLSEISFPSDTQFVFGCEQHYLAFQVNNQREQFLAERKNNIEIRSKKEPSNIALEQGEQSDKQNTKIKKFKNYKSKH